MIEIRKYEQKDATVWDAFVDASKNGTFMLKRGYMEYHSDRFEDNSLLFYNDDKLVALLPASIHGNELRSHGGLTYGGMVVGNKMTVQLELQLFGAMRTYLREHNISNLIYKRVPSIYCSYPSDEDLCALYRNDAKLVRRDVSCTIYQPEKYAFTERRRRGVKKAIKTGIVVKESDDFKTYMNLVADVLRIHHDAKPVHTSEEVELLAKRFPENIKLYAAFRDNEMLAGVLLYITPKVAHTQYIANSEEGRMCGALDAVMDFLINERYADKVYFDFGTSMGEGESYLNEGLITQKQEFGGRVIVYDIYELKI